MKREELEKKYGKKLIDKIFAGDYLVGCTFSINKDGTEDIPESDIRLVIREMKEEKIGEWDYDLKHDILFFKVKDREYSRSIEINNMVLDLDSKDFLVGLQIFEASNSLI